MKIGNFEVQVTSPEGLPFHEVLDASTGEVYVVAESGKRFELRHRGDPRSVHLLPDGHAFFFSAKIDGRGTGTTVKVIRGKYECKHVGFLHHGDANSATYDLFEFASATPNEAVQANSSEFQEGKIEVIVQETQRAPGVTQCKPTQDYTGSKVPSLPEGKKFFLAPSLTTASAGTVLRAGIDHTKYEYVGSPAATFKIRYETPTTLLLRKILNRDNPAHAAILNSFSETRIVPSSIAQPAASAMGSTGPGPSRQQQQHPRVKRERDVATNTDEIIDLLDPTRVSIRVAENLGPNEELLCDLTGDDDTPQWAKRQKPAIDIDETQSTE